MIVSVGHSCCAHECRASMLCGAPSLGFSTARQQVMLRTITTWPPCKCACIDTRAPTTSSTINTYFDVFQVPAVKPPYAANPTAPVNPGTTLVPPCASSRHNSISISSRKRGATASATVSVDGLVVQPAYRSTPWEAEASKAAGQRDEVRTARQGLQETPLSQKEVRKL